jgi:hypothetical protein
MNVQSQTQELTGFGYHTAEEVQELQKALSIGGQYATTTPGNLSGGPALAVEDLDRTLKLVTASLEDLVLWKDVIKQKVMQTVGQYNVQNQYGNEVSPFFTMGSTPTSTDAGYNRDVFIVKYLGTQGSVQHNLTLIQAAHGPVVAREVKNKTVELLERNERAMFDADSTINSLEYDGIDSQIRVKGVQSKYIPQGWVGYNKVGVDDTPVLDTRSAGATSQLSQDFNEEAALRALNNFGRPKQMYLATDIHSEYSRSFYLSQRTMPGMMQPSGWYTPDFRGTLKFDFRPSVFLRARQGVLSSAVSAGSAPTFTLSHTAGAGSMFAASDAGTYSYQISAVYADGETLPAAASSVSVVAGDVVSAAITYSGSPLYFNIFRAPINTTVGQLFIGRIAPAGTGVSTPIDSNVRLPGSSRAYLLMNDPDVLAWKQLGSLIKYDLAVTNTSYQWLQLLYGSMLVTGPRKNVIIDNLG